MRHEEEVAGRRFSKTVDVDELRRAEKRAQRRAEAGAERLAADQHLVERARRAEPAALRLEFGRGNVEDQAPHHRRHEGDARGALILEIFQEAARREFFARQQAAAVQERQQRDPDAEAEGDVEDEQRAVALAEGEQALDRLELAVERAMREHRALRHAGRARGEDDKRGVVEDGARRRWCVREDLERNIPFEPCARLRRHMRDGAGGG